MTVHTNHNVCARADDTRLDRFDQFAVLLRRRVADRIGDVDRARTLFDRDGADLAQIINITARRILG